MSTTFPTSKQTFTAALATSYLDTPSHSEYHNNMADTVEAIEEALGIGSVVKFGLRPASDSATAIRLQKADGSVAVLTIDTTNNLAVFLNAGLAILDTNASHSLIVKPGSDLSANRTLTLTTGDADRTLTISGNLNIEAASNINQDVTTDADVAFTSLTLSNTGLHLLDTNASHDLIIKPGSDLTADRTLTITTGDGDRTLTLSGNLDVELASNINQDLTTDASPTFAGLTSNGIIALPKTGTATAGTQYDSYALSMTCSVWDTTNSQAEDRTWTMKAVAGSGVHGSEPSYVDFVDNDTNTILKIDSVRNEIRCNAMVHLANDDLNTGVILNEDAILIYAGGKLMFWSVETVQDLVRLGDDSGSDIDVYIGLNGAIFVEGSSGNTRLQNTLTLDNTGLHLLDTNASHDLVIKPGSDLTADRTLTLTTGDSDRTLTINGNATLNDWFDQSLKQADSPTFAGVTLNNAGLHLLDTNASHDLIIAPGSDLTADHTLTLTTGDSDRTLTINGNATLNDWFDQSVKQADTPTFAGINLNTKEYIIGLRETLADDATTSLGVTITHSCRGWIISSNSGVIDAYAEFVLGGDGNVTLMIDSGNVVANADTDANLCVGTAASQEPLTIKNRLGGSREVLIGIIYY